jgi:hypothetical protein
MAAAMTLITGYLAEIQNAIKQRYGCQAVHRETVFVEEKTGHNETIWFGDVEVFDLDSRAGSDKCYAWQSIEEGVRIVTILHNRLVDSPARAVQAAIFIGIQRPTVQFTDDLASLEGRVEKGESALDEVVIKAKDLEAIVQTVIRNSSVVFPGQQ